MNEQRGNVPVKILVPVGMLGGGFPKATITRGLELGADVIAVDGGSTDSGPHYLGASQPKTARPAVMYDMRRILLGARLAGIPVIVGSCGTSGTDSGVDWLAGITAEIAAQEGLDLVVARIYSEIEPVDLHERLKNGRIHPLPPAQELEADVLDACEHIVGLMGHDPIVDALNAGANVVLAGRCTDTAIIAAVPMMRGLPWGPTWHAAKIAECGGVCTTGNGFGGVMVSIDDQGFDVEPLDESSACTPFSVAAHMLYENSDPFVMREPAGTLDTSQATYTALDDRRVRVEGSRFELAQQQTIKLEGAAAVGCQTVSIVGIRDNDAVARIDTWMTTLETFLHDRIPTVLGLEPGGYDIRLKAYGHNAVLGDLDPALEPAREVGVMFSATAADQATATMVAKFANPYLLHHPLPGMDFVPSWSFSTSPAEMERGIIYAFVLQHAVEVDSPTELTRMEVSA